MNWVVYEQQTFISHSFGGWEVQAQVQADTVSGEYLAIPHTVGGERALSQAC